LDHRRRDGRRSRGGGAGGNLLGIRGKIAPGVRKEARPNVPGGTGDRVAAGPLGPTSAAIATCSGLPAVPVALHAVALLPARSASDRKEVVDRGAAVPAPAAP